MINIAIIGTGNIVTSALPIIHQNKEYNICAIYARPHSLMKAKQMAKEYNIAKVYTDYTLILQDKEIDFVYIAVVNIAHFDMCKEALLAGKNVIAEKPLCPTSKEVKQLFELAIQKHLYLFEAVTLLHSPNYSYIKENLDRLGRIKLIQCNYSQYSSRYERYLNHDVAPAFNPEMKGGALYDINIYNINFVVSLFGKPLSNTYYANRGFNGIDTSGIALLEYDGFIAQCTGAKDSSSPNYCTVQGEKGWIKVNSNPNEFRKIEVQIGKDRAFIEYEQYPSRLADEFIHFAKIYSEKDYETMLHYMNISIEVAETIDSLQAY